MDSDVTPQDPQGDAGNDAGNVESYNPWTVVHVVFEHLADVGLHPVLGATGHPGEPAAELLRCLGIQPDPQGDKRLLAQKDARLAELRDAMFGDT